MIASDMRKFSIILCAFLLSSCYQKGADAPRSDTAPQSNMAINVETLAQGLEFPWGLAFLPDGSALVTEKAGRLRLLKDNKLSPPINGLPKDILYDGQAGLFDVAAHPDYANNHIIYITYAKGTKDENATTLLKAKFENGILSDVKEIFRNNIKKKGTAHFGGRILFPKNQSILLSLGEGFDFKEQAQNPQNDLGKVVNLDFDGRPIANVTGWRPEIYSIGHRNPQGLTQDTQRGIIYEIEHGPMGGDEINILEKGKNYGWPKITYGVDYTGLKISDYVAMAGMEQPLLYWVPSIAPSAATFYDKDLFKDWKGDILVSALAGQQLRRVDLENGKVKKEETFLTDLKTRFRNIKTANDGSIWVLTDEPDGKILRLTPK